MSDQGQEDQVENEGEPDPQQDQQEEEQQEQEQNSKEGEDNGENEEDPKNLVNEDEEEQEEGKQQQNEESQEDRLIREREERIAKLAEKRSLPTRKDEAIQYLFERLQQAETAIFDLHQIIQKEAKKKEEIVGQLHTKTEELNSLLAQEQATIKQKVEKEIEITLEFALNRNAQTEKEKEETVKELESQRKSNQDIQKEVQQLETTITEQKVEIVDLKGQIHLLTEENTLLKEEKQIQSQKAESKRIAELEEELAQAKIIIQQLSDVRSAITKFSDKQSFRDGPSSSRQPDSYQRKTGGTSSAQKPSSKWQVKLNKKESKS